jgi:hypothetical protein
MLEQSYSQRPVGKPSGLFVCVFLAWINSCVCLKTISPGAFCSGLFFGIFLYVQIG